MTSAAEYAMTDLGMLIEAANANFKFIPGPVYNVQGYGAKGDGVTDDAPVLQSLIDKVNASGGGVIYFPPGTYLLTSANATDPNCHIYLNNVANIIFSGSGASSVIKANSTNKDIFRITGGSTQCAIENLVFDRIPGAIEGGNGIHFYNWYACPKWSAYNVTIQNQYNGLYADTARPQNSMWESCRFNSNVNNGVELVMNNDEFFDTCTFSNNGNHGIQIGGSTTNSSDGAVYLDNCLIYANGKNGVNATGTPSQSNYNLFITGGIIDNQGQYGIYMTHSQTVQISTTVTFNGKKGIYLGEGCREIRLSDVKVSDSSEEGLYIDSGAKYITGSGIQAISNGRSVSGSYYGIKIVGNVQYVNFVGGISGNADDTTLGRQTQDGGIYVDATGGTPDYLTFIGFHFPGMSNVYTPNGTVGNRIQVLDVEGRAIGLQIGQYFGFAGSGGAQRVRYNDSTGNIEFEWNVGTSSGAWNGPHFTMGTYHLWVDASGRLRIKSGAPASDTDGTVIGTQS